MIDSNIPKNFSWGRERERKIRTTRKERKIFGKGEKRESRYKIIFGISFRQGKKFIYFIV